MQALKMTFVLSSLLMLILSSAVAMPVVQKEKTTPANETAHTPPKSEKQLNFIQKFMLKKVQKKVKKATNEDKYRKRAKWSVILGALAVPSFFLPTIANSIARAVGKTIAFTPFANILFAFSVATFLIFAIMAIALGTKVEKNTKNEKTKMMARAGRILGITSLLLVIALILIVAATFSVY